MSESPPPPGPSPEEIASISLDQAKALASPLRRRMLSALRVTERSPFQLAKDLGEPPTKLYHHIRVLAKAGLIVPTRTEQRRGVKEQYYIARAGRFEAKAASPDSLQAIFHSALAASIEELNLNFDSQRIEKDEHHTFLSASTKVYADNDALREFAEFAADWIARNRTPASNQPGTFVSIATFPTAGEG